MCTGITFQASNGDVIFGSGDKALDIEERHITVIKRKPLNTP